MRRTRRSAAPHPSDRPLRASLDGPSRTIKVEPVEKPLPAAPRRADPEQQPEPPHTPEPPRKPKRQREPAR